MLLKIAAQTQNVGLGPKEISCVKSFLARSATNSEINRSFGSLLEVITIEIYIHPLPLSQYRHSWDWQKRRYWKNSRKGVI